ncbi:MAG: hypothetical protein EXS55_01675 [Candidatus Magasanikbacteria bacterium]|nr:hypothetical protein [Candidatus Magasanikbacteria bacterium]
MELIKAALQMTLRGMISSNHMYLAIDTGSPDSVTLYYYDKARSHRRDFSLIGEGSVVRSIEALLTDLEQPLAGLKGVCAVVGHGRWTAIRVAVVVANALAYTLSIPVAAITSAEHIDEAWVILSKQPAGKYILPAYNGEARIGSVKSSKL